MTTTTHIVVIGGGYAGVMAANRLTRRDDVAVTLVNPRATFVERIRLHQLVGGTDDAVVDYREVLAGRVRLVVDTVTRIDPDARRLFLAAGEPLTYDYLVYAVGSRSAAPGVPGGAEHAYPLAGLEQAQRLRAALDEAPADAPVTVVGGGPTGIETATELAEAGRTVTLVAGETLGPYLHPRGRRTLRRHLAAAGVRVVEGPGATVTSVAPDAVALADRRRLTSAVTVWTAGFGVPDLAARSGLRTDDAGRLLTDETLTSLDDPRIVATGDAAAQSGLPYRMSCQAAVQLGPQAAQTVLSRLAGERPAPVEVAFVSTCLSLGRRSGLLQLARRDDTAVGLHLGGRGGARIKELICAGTVWQLAHEARRPGRHDLWARDPRRRALVDAAPAVPAR